MFPELTWIAASLALLSLALIGLAAYAYVGYPLVVRWLVPRRPLPALPEADESDLPRVAVLIAAYNEANVIEARVTNALEQDYPADKLEVLVISDGSDDGTDDILQRFADPRVRVFRQEPREGKTAGINRIAPETSADVIVHTDADTFFFPRCVRALAEAFRHGDVGVATGEVSFTNADEPGVACGEGLYWRFEHWTKRCESERGLLAVADGAVCALRASLWRPLPHAISGDAAEPLVAAREGFRTIVVPAARAYLRAAQVEEELPRKARIISQQVVCARWVGLASLPLRTLWSYVSHKLLRYLVPVLLATALAAALAAGVLGTVAGWILAAAMLAPFVLAPFSRLGLPGPLGRLVRVSRYFVLLQVASLVGLWKGLRGRADVTWSSPESTRKTSSEDSGAAAQSAGAGRNA